MAGRRGTGKGRKKVVIQRIEDKAARDVCFSKRRKGLFSKANDLAVMCGAEVAAIVYSPAGKAFSFGHPSAEDIVNRFLGTAEQAGEAGARQGADVDRDRLAELQQEYNRLGAELAAADEWKERWGEAIAKDRAEGSQAAAWLDTVADQRDMGDADRLACAASLREAQVTVAARVNQVLQDGRREQEAAVAARVNQVLQGQKAPLGLAAQLPPQLLAGGGGFELGGTSVNGWTQQMIQQELMMTVMPTPGFAGGVGFELGGISANGMMEELMPAIAGGGGFEFGCTSANGRSGMEENFHQQQMMTPMPQLPEPAGGGGFELGGTSADGGIYEMMMTAMPPPLGFATGMEMMQQQQQMVSGMPTPQGLAAGMEMQQQQQHTMTELPPLPVFAAGTAMMQQQEVTTATPPAPRFTAGMEMMHQESGPYGRFLNWEEDEVESDAQSD